MPSDLVLGGRTFVIPDNATDPTDPELWFTQFAHSLAEQADRVLITSGTLTAAANLTVDGISALYKRVVVKGRWTGASSLPVTVQVRSAGTPNTSSNYAMQYGNDESTSPTAQEANATSSAEVLLTSVEGVQFELVITDLGAARPTWFRSEMQAGVTNPQLREYAAAHNVASAFDGFRLTPSFGTLTGEYEVWGELATGADLALDAMANRYLGAKSSDPTADNYGNTLANGAMYWSTTAQQMKVWNGSAWLPFTGGYSAKTSAYTLAVTDSVIDVTSGTWTLTLPTAASAAGREYTIRVSAAATVTLDPNSTELIAGAATLAVPGRGSIGIISTGTAWVILRGDYWDETVGRRHFEWDHNNQRWQMTFGDTGARDVTSLLSAITNATYRIAVMRRIGNTVTLTVTFSTGASAGGGSLYTPPSGFGKFTTADLDEAFMSARIGTGGNAGLGCLSAATGASLWRLDWSALSGGACSVQARFETPDAWPSSLPGSALGSIPSS